MNDNTLNNPFWQYACALYKRPDIANILLQLQDEHDLNIPVILLLIWLGEQGIAVTVEELQGFIAIIEELNSQIMQPLRALRRHIKNRTELSPAPYTQVKTLELAIEQEIFALLYQHFMQTSFKTSETSCLTCNLKFYVLANSGEQQRLIHALHESVTRGLALSR